MGIGEVVGLLAGCPRHATASSPQAVSDLYTVHVPAPDAISAICSTAAVPIQSALSAINSAFPSSHLHLPFSGILVFRSLLSAMIIPQFLGHRCHRTHRIIPNLLRFRALMCWRTLHNPSLSESKISQEVSNPPSIPKANPHMHTGTLRTFVLPSHLRPRFRSSTPYKTVFPAICLFTD